jgi:hypothetical protein
MTKLPPNAKRVILNGNPSIAYEDEAGRIIRVERDLETELARMPVNARLQALKSPKQKWRKAGTST